MKNGVYPHETPDSLVDRYSAHIYSNGTTVKGLFETREDSVRGMNIIAINAWASKVKILITELMKTHFHVVVQGDPLGCEKMSLNVKRQLEAYMRKTGRPELIPNGIEVSHDPIETINELRNKFMYVYRNCIAAGYNRQPWEYGYGPGNIFYVNHSIESEKGLPLERLSKRRTRELFHTWVDLPQEWRHDDSMMLLPHSYIDWEYVEKLFINPKVFIAYMHQRKDIEAKIDRECASRAVEKASEVELGKEASDLCRTLFGRNAVSKASVDERIAVAQRLWGERRTYSIPLLSRVTKLDKTLLMTIFGIKE